MGSEPPINRLLPVVTCPGCRVRMAPIVVDSLPARRELRALIDAEVKFLKKYVPGFDQAVLNKIGRFVGVRDGRHPVGEHVFCLDDADVTGTP